MHSGLDLPAALHDLLTAARAAVASATRSMLLVAESNRLACVATIGFVERFFAGQALALEALSALGSGIVTTDADAWYCALLSTVPSTKLAPAGAVVHVLPLVAGSGCLGALVVEKPANTDIEPQVATMLALLADKAALLIERRNLYREQTQTAQYVQLLSNVVYAVTRAADPAMMVHALSTRIKNVLPHQQWRTVRLALLEGEDARSLHVYEVSGRPVGEYWSNVYQGAQRAASELGVQVTTVSAIDVADQLAELARLVAHSDAVALAPLNPAAVEPLIGQLREAGKPVITFDSPPIAGSQSLAYVGTDNVAAGRLAGQLFTRLLPQGGMIGIGVEALQAMNVTQRLVGFADALAGTNLHTLAPIDSEHDFAQMVARGYTCLREHPEVIGAFGACASNGPGWGLAARAINRTETLKIVCFDLSADTIALLKEGVIHAAIAQREYAMGYYSVELLARMIAYGPDKVLAELPSSRIFDTGVDVVTLERTKYSVSLAEYLLRPLAVHSSWNAEQPKHLLHNNRLPTIAVIGKAEQVEEVPSEQVLPITPKSLVGRVIESGKPLVINPLDPNLAHFDELPQARAIGLHTLVMLPVQTPSTRLGVLMLGSPVANACSAADLSLLDQVTHAIAAVLENGRLLGQLTRRTDELEVVSARQELLLQTIGELSSPVAPIAKQILVMPVVGIMDGERVGRFLETLLREIETRRARAVLLDISGVSVVDTYVAKVLIQASQAARLLGAELVLVGITPAVAQTIVHLGVTLADIVTCADLERGFAYALARLGGRVVYRKS